MIEKRRLVTYCHLILSSSYFLFAFIFIGQPRTILGLFVWLGVILNLGFTNYLIDTDWTFNHSASISKEETKNE